MESVLWHLYDVDVLLAPSGKEQDAAKKKQMRQDLAAGPLTTWLGFLNKQLGASTSGFICGQSLTIADLALFCRMQSLKGGKYDDIPGDIVERVAPHVDAHYSHMLAHPKISEWYATHAL